MRPQVSYHFIPVNDPRIEWDLLNDETSLHAMIVGLVHPDTSLSCKDIARYLQIENPSVFGTRSGQMGITGEAVHRIFSWVRKYRDAFKNPYNMVTNMFSTQDEYCWRTLDVLKHQDASMILLRIENKLNIEGAGKRWIERADILWKVEVMVDEWEEALGVSKRNLKEKEEEEEEKRWQRTTRQSLIPPSQDDDY